MQLCHSLSILWHWLSLGLEWKLTFSHPVATSEFSKLLAYWVYTFTASCFRIWNSSTGIPSPPLAFFVVMLSKAHFTSHSRISSVAHSCRTLCDPMNCSTPGLLVHHQLLEFTQTHVHRVKAMVFSSSHAWMWQLDCEEGWAPENWCFWTVVEKTLESSLDCKEI